MNKFHPCRCRNVLLSLGLALGLLCIVPSGCLGQTMGTTSFSVQNRWQLSLPAPHSLLNAGPMVPLEPELTGLFLLNGEGVWLLGNGGRFVFADTLQLRLDREEPEIGNRLNELYFTLNPVDYFFLDLGKQVVVSGGGFFLNPAGLWPEQTTWRQDRTLPPEGKVIVRGEYLFSHLTMEVGWAPQLAWAENKDGVLWRYIGSPQKTAQTWVMVSSGLAGVDLGVLLAYRGRWKAGLSLAKVWGERLATHCAIGWEERDKSQAEQGNKLYRVLVEEATGAAPPPTVLPSVAWEQMMIQNLVDRSGLALFYLRFERDHFGLALGVQQPYGKNASEFGLLNSERQVTLQIHFGL